MEGHGRRVRVSMSTVSMITQRDDELPDELVSAIQRVLDLQTTQNDDPLDVLSSRFDLTGILNSYFPKGMS